MVDLDNIDTGSGEFLMRAVCKNTWFPLNAAAVYICAETKKEAFKKYDLWLSKRGIFDVDTVASHFNGFYYRNK